MFFILSKILDIFLAPLAWSVGLIALGLWPRSPSRVRRLVPLVGLSVLLFFSLEAVSNRLWRSLEADAERTMKPGATYDVVVLLGGVSDERIEETWHQHTLNDSGERLLETFDLLRTGTARNAILSAGSLPGTQSESYALKEELVAWGIAPDRVIVEDQAKNTHENAVFSAAIIRARAFSSVLVVTSAFHAPRSLGCFRAEKLPVDMQPVDYRSFGPAYGVDTLPRADHLEQSSAAIREWFGRIVYRLRGYSA